MNDDELAKSIKKANMSEVYENIKGADIPLGAAYLNLACSDNAAFGGCTGTMMNIIGDEATGKTVQAKTLFAECNMFEHLDKYDFVYDNPEYIDFFDDDEFFGEVISKRVKPPYLSEKNGDKYGSTTIQEFQINLWKALEKPTIYVLDSFDALGDEEEIKKMDSKAKGKKVAGGYGMGKAKGASELFRIAISKLEQTGSFLLIISQTRENINPLSMKKKTRNGGKALDFYACHIVWLALEERIYREYRKRKVEIGHRVKAKVSKNKLTGKKRMARYPLYLDYGVDSIRSCMYCMKDLGLWAKTGSMETPWGKMAEAKLVDYIEENDLEDDFAELCEEEWIAFETHIKSKRKRKY
jgi:RecA/RadA recombinase